MKKIIPIKHEKIWGYELVLHSPLKASQSKLEDGTPITDGPLIKILKADQPLSVQVHPDDKLAKELENEPNGKSECWYVLEKTNKTEYIVGIKTGDENIIKNSLKDKTFQEQLIKINPNIGDFINVPAGLVHGVGAESKVLEVQQPSDTTYRFYDYDRLQDGQPRELHIDKSIKSLKKELNWKLSKNTSGAYEVQEYQIKIFNSESKVENNGVVVDLDKEEAYMVEKNEQVNFKHWALITY